MSVFHEGNGRLESDLVDRLDHPPVRGRGRAASEPDVDVRFADLAVPREIEHAALLVTHQSVRQGSSLQVVLEPERVLSESAVRELRGRHCAYAALLAGERPLKTWIRHEMPALDAQPEDRNEFHVPEVRLAHAVVARQLHVQSPIEA